MKYPIWPCIFQFVLLSSFAQSPTDSLRASLAKARAEENVTGIQRSSSQLAWTFLNTKDYDSALKYYHQSLDVIPLGQEQQLQGNILTGLGSTFLGKGKFDSCIFYYRSALDRFHIIEDTTNARIVESNLSIVYKNLGLYEESLRSTLNVISSLKPSDNSILKGSCYNTIGAIYTHTHNFTKALEYYYLALENRRLNKQIADIARIHNNIGEVFTFAGQYDSAASNLQRALTIKRDLKDTRGLARTLNNLGKVYALTGNTSLAANQFNEARAIQNEIDDPIGMIELLNNVAQLNITTKDFSSADLNLKLSQNIIHRVGTPDYLRQNLELHVRLDRERRDFASGMLHLEQLSTIRDSLLNQEKDRSMQAMQIRYETQKKEQQIALLQQSEEINQARIRNNQILIAALAVGLILVAVVGLLAYINFRNARDARQRIELLLADTRHRVKNNLQVLASIFHLQAKQYSDHNMAMEALSSESRVHAMSLLHQKFYAVNPGHTIDLRKYVPDLVEKITDIYGFRSRLALTTDVDDIHLDIDKALPLSLILQELISNAFKYAFNNEPSPRLTISIKLNNTGDQVSAIISDNGMGIGEPQPVSSQGLVLVEDFTDQLDGKVDTKTHNGTTFTITFPLSVSWKRHSFLL